MKNSFMRNQRFFGAKLRRYSLIVVFVLAGMLLAHVGSIAAPASAATNPVQALLQPIPAAASIKIGATQAAKSVKTAQAVQVINGTGNGGARANSVANGKTYVTTAYPASILPTTLALGPYSYKDSVELGRRQAVLNAKAHPQAVNQYEGGSQGESAAWNAAATDGHRSHVSAWGPPSGTGNGFVDVMPGNLIVTQIGNVPALPAGDTADLRLKTGDCWGNMPDVRNVFSDAACIFSTKVDHYESNGYANFKEDQVIRKGNVTIHVQHTENGLVLLGKMLNPRLPENQKAFLRQLAPQGTPGKPADFTLRKLVEQPQKAIAALMPKATKAPAQVKVAPTPAVMPDLAKVAGGVVNDFQQGKSLVQVAQHAVQQFTPAASVATHQAAPAPPPQVQKIQNVVHNAVHNAPAPVQDFLHSIGVR